MSLINYIEPTNFGDLFFGMGSLIIALVVAYIFYRIYIKFAQWFGIIINREAKYEILQEAYLDKYAAERGINLNKKMIELEMLRSKPKNLRKRIEEEIFDDLFEKKK